MRGLGIVVAVVLCAGAAGAQEPAAYDLGPVRPLLRLFHDGKGHYVALVPFARCLKDEKLKTPATRALFYGDGTTFYHQHSPSGGASCPDRAEDSFWEPRVAHQGLSLIAQHGGKITVTCGERKTELAALADAETHTRVAAAKFLERRWSRQEYALARDELGNYYYVDVRSGPKGRDFRLYVGPRGNLKLQRMKNVVSDSEGDIFSTDRGELRLILGRDEAVWVKGKKRTKLLLVPTDRNRMFIYTELGPYLGERLGTPCDDL